MANFFSYRFRATFNLFNSNRFISRKIFNQPWSFAEEDQHKRELDKLKEHYEKLVAYKKYKKDKRRELDYDIMEISSTIRTLEEVIAQNSTRKDTSYITN